MNQRELAFKSIANAFALWEVNLRNLASVNFFDAHIVSEQTMCDLLNEAYGYKLTSANRQIRNQAAIDLVDDRRRVAFQVTASATAKAVKIQRMLDVFHAQQLGGKYDRVVVVVIGKKQRSYKTIKVPGAMGFDTSRDIWDTSTLLRCINSLPDHKLSKINRIVAQATEPPKLSTKRTTGAALVKKSLAWRNRLTKSLLRKLDREHWELCHYEPWHKFKWDRMLIRSAEARPFKYIEDGPGVKISTEFRLEPWDFYDNGLEFLSMGGDAIFDKDGHWDILGLGDEREERPEYRVVRTHAFVRIPYEYMVELDLETEYPTLYVTFSNDGTPYEEVRHGVMGVFRMRQHRKDFDPQMRRPLP